MFYPGFATDLRSEIATLLASAPRHIDLRPKALIVPHAGYIYSGAVAATAYALLVPLAAEIKRVVLLGPVHRVWTQGLALPEGA